MNNTYSQSGQSPRYVEVGPNGQVLHKSSVIPSDLVANLPILQGSMTSNSTSSNAQYPSYPYQTSNKKQWWQNVGAFTPYRTTYQDYGQRQNQSNSMSNIYGQGSNANDASWGSFGKPSYLEQSSRPFNSPHSSEYM